MGCPGAGADPVSDDSPELNSGKTPDRAARAAGVHLWREFFLHLPGSDEAGDTAIALRCYCGIR